MAVDNKIQKEKELELSTDIDSLTASSNQLAEKTEISRDMNMSILVKSTAMRKACKEKTAKMTARQAVGRQAP